MAKSETTNKIHKENQYLRERKVLQSVRVKSGTPVVVKWESERDETLDFDSKTSPCHRNWPFRVFVIAVRMCPVLGLRCDSERESVSDSAGPVISLRLVSCLSQAASSNLDSKRHK